MTAESEFELCKASIVHNILYLNGHCCNHRVTNFQLAMCMYGAGEIPQQVCAGEDGSCRHPSTLALGILAFGFNGTCTAHLCRECFIIQKLMLI